MTTESKNERKSVRECIKVANLRKLYGRDMNLRKWLDDENNMYVGRHGRIFIDKEIFHYNGSKWANPFTVKEHGLDRCIELYKTYIFNKIEKNPEVYNLDELRNKNLGCFCNISDKCHVDILLEILQ